MLFLVTGDLKAGVYASDPSSNNSLFTFGTNGSNKMSVGVEGSLFVGTAMPSNNGGLSTAYSGWLVVQAGGKFGGDIDTLGGLNLTDATSGKIQFSDGTIQRTAYTSNHLTTANVVELTNLYFTNARVFSAVTGNLALKANVIDLTSANVIELTNLYFTNARSRAAISVGSGGSYDSSTGIITVTSGFVASTVTTFPGHSGNEDYGDLTTATVDAFGVATGVVYDCMEPVGSLVLEDLVVL